MCLEVEYEERGACVEEVQGRVEEGVRREGMRREDVRREDVRREGERKESTGR